MTTISRATSTACTPAQLDLAACLAARLALQFAKNERNGALRKTVICAPPQLDACGAEQFDATGTTSACSPAIKPVAKKATNAKAANPVTTLRIFVFLH
jgi:hypothetical protein